MEKNKVKKTMAKKMVKKKEEINELMDLQNIVIGMHKKLQLIENRTSSIESWVKKVRTRIGV
tara:strand:+ start:576 stop:761 length:186 start_codon:yes stop_codon:yes gene_type:complete